MTGSVTSTGPQPSVAPVQNNAHLRKMARSGGLNLVGALVGALNGFALTAAVTNWMPRSEAGMVFAASSLFMIGVAITQLGAESGVVRFLPMVLVKRGGRETRRVLRAALLPVAVFSVLAAAAVAVAAEPIARHLLGASDLVTATVQVRILACFLPVAALLNTCLAATRGLQTMFPTVIVESIGRTLTQLLAVALVAFLSVGPVGVIATWAGPYLPALVTCVVWLTVLVRRVERDLPGATDGDGALPVPGRHRARHRRQDPVGRAFWRYTAPRAMATIAQTVFKRADIVLVAALRSPAEAALYAAASRFVTVGLIGVQAIQQSLAPQLSAMFSRGQREEAQHVYQLATAWSIAIAWPIYLACAALAPLLLGLFGEGFAEAAPTVVVLNLAMLFAVAAGPVDTVLLMSGRSVLSLINTASAAIVDIGLCFLLVPHYGYAGAGWAWAAAMIVRNALPLMQVRRFLGMSPLGPVTIRVSGYAFGCFAVVPLGLAFADLPTWSILAALVGCGLIFIVLLWFSRESLHLSDLVGAFRKRRKSGAADPSGH